MIHLREDHVGILWVAGRAVRQVWIGGVRSLCLSDLMAAIPSLTVIVDRLRDDVDRDIYVRTVRTVADWFCQQVEVVSVIGLLEIASVVGFDPDLGPVDGRFWDWAGIFPERAPFQELDTFRICSRSRDTVIDHAYLRPAPSLGSGSRHPFRASIISHFPQQDWARASDGRRPIPEVRFAYGEVAALVARIGSEADRRGRVPAIFAVNGLRPLAPFLSDAPKFEGRSFRLRIDRGDVRLGRQPRRGLRSGPRDPARCDRGGHPSWPIRPWSGDVSP